MNEAEVIVAEVLDPKSENAPWWIKDGNGTVYKTWNPDEAKLAKELKGGERRVRIGFELKESQKDGRTYQDKIVKEFEAVAEQPPQNGSDMTKEDWEKKDLMKCRTALWKSYLEGELPKLHSALIEPSEDFNAQMFVRASNLIHRAELDIYRGFLRDDQVPF